MNTTLILAFLTATLAQAETPKQIVNMHCEFLNSVSVADGTVTPNKPWKHSYEVALNLRTKKGTITCTDYDSDTCQMDGSTIEYDLKSEEEILPEAAFDMKSLKVGRGRFKRVDCDYVFAKTPTRFSFEGGNGDDMDVQMRFSITSSFNKDTNKCELDASAFFGIGDDEFDNYSYYLPDMTGNTCVVTGIQ